MAEFHDQQSAGAAAPVQDQPAEQLGAAPLPAPARLPATPVEPLGEEASPRMTIGEHLDELRRRLIYALGGVALTTILTMATGTWLLKWMEYPYVKAMKDVGVTDPQLVVLSVTGAFGMYLKITFYCGLALAMPWVIYQLWMFVSAGLYPKERRYVTWSIPFALLLFLAGATFGVLVSVPAIKFFVQFGRMIGVTEIITLDYYIDFMLQLVLVFGLAFQVPLVVLALAKLGLVKMHMLNRYRRHVIVGMCIVAAIFAPADMISMLAMTGAMCALYEGGVLLSWLLVFRKARH